MIAPDTHYFTLEGAVRAARILNDSTTRPYVVLLVPEDRRPRDGGCWRVAEYRGGGYLLEVGSLRFLCIGGTVHCVPVGCSGRSGSHR